MMFEFVCEICEAPFSTWEPSFYMLVRQGPQSAAPKKCALGLDSKKRAR
jgi:hypothetical protein